MKKLCVVLILFVAVFLGGCRYYGIAADPGSKWSCAEPLMNIVLISDTYAEGTITIDGQTIDIECMIGPGKTDIAVLRREDWKDYIDADSYLFKGNYRYNRRKDTITITIIEEQIGMVQSEIVLSKD